MSYTVTVTLPLIGDVTITVDASTGTIADVTVAPITGVVAGDPVIDGHHVSIDVTLADGTTTTVVLDAHVDDNGVEVEVEGPEHESGDDGDHSGPPAIEDRGDSAEHRQDDQGHRGHGEGIPASNVAPAPNDSPADGSHGQGQESEHSGRR